MEDITVEPYMIASLQVTPQPQIASYMHTGLMMEPFVRTLTLEPREAQASKFSVKCKTHMPLVTWLS